MTCEQSKPGGPTRSSFNLCAITSRFRPRLTQCVSAGSGIKEERMLLYLGPFHLLHHEMVWAECWAAMLPSFVMCFCIATSGYSSADLHPAFSRAPHG